jgi:riboflavin kinase / FMN adenylyltransferase
MRIITNLRQIKRRFKRPVVAIGIFDGVHLGHKQILKMVSRKARRINGTSVAITFNPHPAKILDLIGAPPLLVSLKHRIQLIKNERLDVAIVLNFNATFSRYDARVFVEKVLVKKLGLCHIIIGRDFGFGKNKTGDINLLRSLGRRHGFAAEEAPLLKIGSRPVSSTRIRALIMKGDLPKAARCLGRPVSVLGTVVKGSKRGRLLGFPTANINPHHEVIPPSGVYAVRVVIGFARYNGILNIGTRPTFREKDHEPTIEAHIFGFKGNLYNKDIEVIFIKRIRGEKRFKNKEELISQIRIDEHSALMVLWG